MKYAVIEFRNPEMDACRHHASHIATMLDGGDPWPVTANCVSRLFDTRKEAWEKLKLLLAERKADLEGRVCQPWVIIEGFMETLLVFHDCDDDPDDEYEWVFKMEVVGIPETEDEAKLI